MKSTRGKNMVLWIRIGHHRKAPKKWSCLLSSGKSFVMDWLCSHALWWENLFTPFLVVFLASFFKYLMLFHKSRLYTSCSLLKTIQLFTIFGPEPCSSNGLKYLMRHRSRFRFFPGVILLSVDALSLLGLELEVLPPFFRRTHTKVVPIRHLGLIRNSWHLFQCTWYQLLCFYTAEHNGALFLDVPGMPPC